MKRYNVILFDIDGTIADTDDLLIVSLNTLYDLYRNGQRTPYEKAIYFSGPLIEETLQNEFPHMDQKFMYDEFQRVFQGLYPKMLKGYPGGKEKLCVLKEKGYKLGIVTNKNHESSLYCLEVLGYKDLFDVVVASDDVIHPKPHGEPILKAMALLKEKDLKKVLYVGDNESDYLCAESAHVDSMIVTWGPRKLNKNIKPRYKIASFNEFVEVIENENL